MHGNYMRIPVVAPLRQRAFPAVVAHAEREAVRAMVAATAGGKWAGPFHRPELVPGDLVSVPSARFPDGEEWCRIRRILPGLPDEWLPRDAFLPPDWTFNGHYFLDPRAFTTAFSHAANLLNRLRDLPAIPDAIPEIEQTLGEFTYLAANFHPFSTGNWGTFYVLVNQARMRAGLPPRPSTGLDFLMMYVDHDQAVARYRHWSQSGFDEWLLSPPGAALLRYPDPARAPQWLNDLWREYGPG